MMAELDQQPTEIVKDWLSLDAHYVTPKLDVRGVVLRGDDHILMVREKQDNLWALPGGWCDVDQSPAECVVKEVYEETGLQVTAARLLALRDKRKQDYPFQIPHAYKAFFLCREEGGRLATATLETVETAFQPLEQLPLLSLHRITESQIRLVVNIARDETVPTAFG